jgi:hypothetical protein
MSILAEAKEIKSIFSQVSISAEAIESKIKRIPSACLILRNHYNEAKYVFPFCYSCMSLIKPWPIFVGESKPTKFTPLSTLKGKSMRGVKILFYFYGGSNGF